MARQPTVLRRALWLALTTLALIATLMAASLIHLYAVGPPCFVQQWRACEPIGYQQVLWFFGPRPVEALAYITIWFGICVVVAWTTLPLRRHRDDMPS